MKASKYVNSSTELNFRKSFEFQLFCSFRLVNPHDVKKPVFIKYCARRDLIGSSAVNSYLPPSSPTGTRFSSSPTAPRSSAPTYTSIAPPLPPVVTVSPTSYRSTFPTNQRAKRVPGQPNDVDLDLLLQQVQNWQTTIKSWTIF